MMLDFSAFPFDFDLHGCAGLIGGNAHAERIRIFGDDQEAIEGMGPDLGRAALKSRFRVFDPQRAQNRVRDCVGSLVRFAPDVDVFRLDSEAGEKVAPDQAFSMPHEVIDSLEPFGVEERSVPFFNNLRMR
jgi:hypothetical protein